MTLLPLLVTFKVSSPYPPNALPDTEVRPMAFSTGVSRGRAVAGVRSLGGADGELGVPGDEAGSSRGSCNNAALAGSVPAMNNGRNTCNMKTESFLRTLI